MSSSDICYKYHESDISKLLYVISRAVRRVKFEKILNYHEWYLLQISREEGVNEVHCGQNGKPKASDVPASTRLQIKKNNIVYCLGQCENGELKFQNIIQSVPRISAPLA